MNELLKYRKYNKCSLLVTLSVYAMWLMSPDLNTSPKCWLNAQGWE